MKTDMNRLYMMQKYEGYGICADSSTILQSAEALGVVPSSYKKEEVAGREHFSLSEFLKHCTTYLLQNSSDLVIFCHDMRDTERGK